MTRAVRAAALAALAAAACAPAPAPAPPAAPPPAPSRVPGLRLATREAWAVIVGAAHPGGSRLLPRKYATADAEAVYTLLTESAGLKKDHVVLLADRSERKPTLVNLKWALGTFLGRSAGRDDLVIMYLAGHGAAEVDPRGTERDGLAKYFLPAGASMDDLHQTALPLSELQIIFDRIQAERVVMFLDASYSGAAGGPTLARKTLDMNRPGGVAIMSAARPNELALEAADLGHGIFTYYVLEGLKGAADLNADGVVSLQELYEYVEQHVARKSRAIGGNQHPVMKGELVGMLLMRVPRP